MRKPIALLLCLCLLLAALPEAALAEEEVIASGKEAGISWKLLRYIEEDAPSYSEAVRIVVSGTGAIPDYLAVACSNTQRAPWWWENAEYLYAVKDIEIGRGITAIGNNAFYLPAAADLSGAEIVVPDTVKRIGDEAFSQGKPVKRLVIPDSVTSFGRDCFDPRTVVVCSSGSAAYQYAAENKTRVEVTDLTVKLSKTSVKLAPGEQATLKATPSAKRAALTYGSSDRDVVNIAEKDGVLTLTAKAAGDATVSVYHYGRLMAKATVKVRAPSCKITYKLGGGTNADGNPKKLTGDESVALASPTRTGYSFVGWMCNGEKVTRVSAADANSNKVIALTAKWRKVTVAAPKSLKLSSPSKHRIAVSFAKVSGAEGYELQYCRTKTFPKASRKSVKLTATSATLTKLTKDKAYYVRVRAWKTDSAGKKVYGDWSDVKKQRTRAK